MIAATRPEHLLVEGAHAGLHAGEHGRAVERTIEGAAGVELRTRRDRVLDDAVDTIDLTAADHRSERHLSGGWIAHGQVLGLGDELLGERVDDVLVRDNEAGRHADLPLMEPGAEGDGGGDRVEIGVVQHDDRVLAAELELHLLEVLARKLADAAPDPARSGERHHAMSGSVQIASPASALPGRTCSTPG